MITASVCLTVGLFAQIDPGFDAPIAVQTPMEIWELRPLEVMPRQSIAPGVVHHYMIQAKEGDRIEGVAAQYGVDIRCVYGGLIVRSGRPSIFITMV